MDYLNCLSRLGIFLYIIVEFVNEVVALQLWFLLLHLVIHVILRTQLFILRRGTIIEDPAGTEVIGAEQEVSERGQDDVAHHGHEAFAEGLVLLDQVDAAPGDALLHFLYAFGAGDHAVQSAHGGLTEGTGQERGR